MSEQLRCLVVQHSPTEDPGLLGGWLAEAGMALDVVAAYDGVPVPRDLRGHDALLVLGGAMAAWDDERAPWLPATRALLRTAVAGGVPTLGVCLGSQLLALACGGRVERGAAGPEHGGCQVVIDRGPAAADPLFAGLPADPQGRLEVVQWHSDTVTELPAGATLLASSAAYPVQAFRVGDRAWGLQFHIETTAGMVERWARDDGVPLDPASLPDLADAWRPFAARFAQLAAGPLDAIA